MQITLPSGNTAEFRDQFLRGDARNARKGMVFVISADGSRRTDGSFMDEITGRVISSMLVAWSFGPKPSEAATDDLRQRILDQLDEDDYAALEKAVGPWVERVMRRDNTQVFTHTASGIKVTPVIQADGDRLAALPDFTVEDDGAGPKAGSTPALPPTGTSSSANPEPGGQTEPSSTPSISS